MSRKQELYRDLLLWGLPLIRNDVGNESRATWWRTSKARRERLREAYHVSEFLHNLYVSILDEEFGSHDIWFLNVQARGFFAKAKSPEDHPYGTFLPIVKELFELVPDDMRDQLQWPGPMDGSEGAPQKKYVERAMKETAMDKFDVIPLRGVPPIELGMSREESRAAMALPVTSYRRGPEGSPLIDAYFNSEFQVSFDGNDCVEYIELSAPIHAVYRGVAVFEILADAMVAIVAKQSPYDPNDREMGYSYTFPAMEMSLWRPTMVEVDQSPDDPDGRYFATIGVGKRGYFSEMAKSLCTE